MPKTTPVPTVKRLSPEAFKETVKAKGWTYRALAERWHLSEVRISQIARNEKRPYYYDDAVYGLPTREPKTTTAKEQVMLRLSTD